MTVMLVYPDTVLSVFIWLHTCYECIYTAALPCADGQHPADFKNRVKQLYQSRLHLEEPDGNRSGALTRSPQIPLSVSAEL